MQPKTPIQPPPSLGLGDIYYVLFKHKWTLLIFSAIGLLGAVAIYFLTPPAYISEAKLLVRYVQDAKILGEDKVRPMQLTSDAIMSAEADILASLDVAGAVVDVVGADKILGKNAATTNRNVAAMALRKQLMVEVPQRGNVLRVIFKHRDPEIVQVVLQRVIAEYFRKHVEIHRNLGFMDDALNQQTDAAKGALAQTEESLRKLKSDYQITSLDDAKRQVTDRMSRVSEDLRGAEVDLEERRAALKELQRAALQEGSVNEPATNAVVVETKPQPKLAPEIIDEYQRLLARLDIQKRKEQDLLGNFRPDSRLVREARGNVEALEKQRKEMIAANPRLVEEQPAPVTAAVATQKRDTKAEAILGENARIAALVAKIKILNAQLERVRSDVSLLDKLEKDIVPLQRKMELEDKNYRYYQSSLNQARFDNSLTGGQLSNIKEIQEPSLAYRDQAPMIKQIAMLAIVCVGFGFGVAFLREFIIDQSVRKPAEVEQKFRLPTFLTIPNFPHSGRRSKKPRLKGPSGEKALPPAGESAAATNGETPAAPAVRGEVAPWEDDHQLHPYSEALRDRLMSFFELKGLTHKPKLVALTSCSPGAGVTTLAAGLAASLSETGEGNVLLVDMNTEQGAAHPFFRGKPACGLSDVLEQEKRPAALVQDNLYMVQGALADDRLPQLLPKRIRHLIPKLQASDYDYIIFDMPPITQTSVTPRLAGFMDMVFVVVEDGKTSREWLKQASSLLQESKANLGAVFNKRRNPVPKWLHQEF